MTNRHPAKLDFKTPPDHDVLNETSETSLKKRDAKFAFRRKKISRLASKLFLSEFTRELFLPSENPPSLVLRRIHSFLCVSKFWHTVPRARGDILFFWGSGTKQKY